jgi:hypothetical protein
MENAHAVFGQRLDRLSAVVRRGANALVQGKSSMPLIAQIERRSAAICTRAFDNFPTGPIVDLSQHLYWVWLRLWLARLLPHLSR